MPPNQNLEQIARNKIDLNIGIGRADREYPTDSGPADYMLFMDKNVVGVIEARQPSKGAKVSAEREKP